MITTDNLLEFLNEGSRRMLKVDGLKQALVRNEEMINEMAVENNEAKSLANHHTEIEFRKLRSEGCMAARLGA